MAGRRCSLLLPTTFPAAVSHSCPAEDPTVLANRWVALYAVSIEQRVMGIASLWSAIVLSMVALAAPAAAEPCPAGQVPVTRGGVCVPLSPLLPAPATPTTAVPTTPAPSPSVTSDPSQGGTVPGQPAASTPTSTARPPGPGTELPQSQAPGTTTDDAAAAVDATLTPSSEFAGAPAPAGSAPSAEASAGVPAGAPARPQTPPRSTLAAAGYLLTIGGILLLAWAAAGFALHRPSPGARRA